MFSNLRLSFSAAFAVVLSSGLAVAQPAEVPQDLTQPPAFASEDVTIIPLDDMPVQSLAATHLIDALRVTYQTNPEIQSARQDLKAIIENVAVALSNYRPDISASGSATTQKTNPAPFGSPAPNQQELGIALSQPLYRGGRTDAAVKAADNRVLAQKALYDNLVQNVFSNVIAAYIGILQNEEVLSLRKNNESVLELQLEANRARFELGATTLTDVSQAKSRLAAARAERLAASAELRSSQAVFRRLTGLQPSGLIMPEVNFTFVETLDNLKDTALEIHPAVRAAQYETIARHSDSREILGQLLPELSLNGSVNRSFNPTFGTTTYIDNSRLTLNATVPLYLGGEARARYRQSKYNALSSRDEAHDVAREVEQNVVTAWENLQAAKAQTQARALQVEATDIAFEGVSAEQRNGARTTLDVLDAEQERFIANVESVTAEFNVITAKYDLLSAVGLLSPAHFGIDDDTENIIRFYNKTRSNWFGFETEVR